VVSTQAHFLPTGKIPALLSKLGKTARVVAPVRASATVTLFQEWQGDAELVLSQQASMPPKEAIFPQTEQLLSYTYVKDANDLTRTTVTLEHQIEDKPTILFGARPCDVQGLAVFDQVFLQGKWQDDAVKARKDALTIVAVLCDESEGTCFCTSVGGSPTATTGSDLALTPVEGGYLAEPITDKGKALVKDEAFTAAKDKQVKEAKRVRDAIKKQDLLPLKDIEQKIIKLFSTEFWDQVNASCISCGACTYVCPACYCFSITDEPAGMQGERIRTWDSCMFYQYTLEASGHNPRPTKADRYRNRIGHKFSYHPTNYKGTFACSGCGRCIKSCPVALDIRQVLREAAKHG
jgi:sulfhydrogenase subunit beta (sulfur reductase)